MKNVYIAVRSIFLFYFIAVLFGPILEFDGNRLSSESFPEIFVPGLVFAILVAALPTILGFFKINNNTGALLLGGIVINFLFYFIGYYVFDFFNIVQGTVVFGFDSFSLDVAGEGYETFGLLVISFISSLLSVLLDVLSKKR